MSRVIDTTLQLILALIIQNMQGFLGTHTEGKLAGRLLKAQPINDRQLKDLQQLNKLID